MNTEIRNKQGEKLDYAFHAAEGSKSKTLVVVGHGVTGNKDRPWDEGLCNALAAGGTAALRFSFSGNGDSEGDFRESCPSKEVADLGSVLDIAEAFGHGPIAYVGHSMGGAVGVLRAARDRRIRYLISLAGMVYTAKFAEVEFGEETPDEGLMWEDEDCPLSKAFVDDMNEIDNVLDRAAQIHVPWLLVHGDADDVVPIEESREIFAKAKEPKKLVEIPGANHVFADDALPPMIDAVSAWLRGVK